MRSKNEICLAAFDKGRRFSKVLPAKGHIRDMEVVICKSYDSSSVFTLFVSISQSLTSKTAISDLDYPHPR
jgi:hypothetical protein